MVDPVLTAFLITLIVLFTVGLLIFVVPLSIRPLLRGKKGARAELKRSEIIPRGVRFSRRAARARAASERQPSVELIE